MNISVEHLTAGYRGKPLSSTSRWNLPPAKYSACLAQMDRARPPCSKLYWGCCAQLKAEFPSMGRIFPDGRPGAWQKHWAMCRKAHTPPFAFRVRDVVLMARSAHTGVFGSPGKQDIAIAEESMERLSILSLANEHYTELSGGERQLVLIARALAQQARVLVLDEPTSNLDFGNQIRVLHHVRELAQSGLGVLMTTHFPDFAFLCASRVALMKQGRILAVDCPDATLTQANLEESLRDATPHRRRWTRH